MPSIAALRLRREGGFAQVSAAEALRLFDESLPRNRPWLRDFAVAARVTPPSLRDCRDADVLAIVRAHVRQGFLVGVRAGRQEQGREDKDTAERRRLAAIVPQQWSELGGCRYRLLADVDLTRLPNRDHYEVVAQAAARQILGELAAQPGVAAARAQLLLQARDKLSLDWRSPFAEAHGLILLRQVRAAVAGATSAAPAITPSQWRALAAADWIEIEFVDPQGRPVDVVARLELPDGTRVELRSQPDGLAARRGFLPGMCRLVLPALDGARWRPGT